MTAATQTPRSYDVIGFGDEVPGVLALVSAAREYRRCTGKALRTLLMFKGNSQEGVGGHLVRGGLAYLDRCSLPPRHPSVLWLANLWCAIRHLSGVFATGWCDANWA